MRYTHPQITGSFQAITTIKSAKGLVPQEINDPTQLTPSAAYQADE